MVERFQRCMHIRWISFSFAFFFFSLLIDINYNVGEDILQGAGSMQMKTNRIKELLSKAKRV